MVLSIVISIGSSIMVPRLIHQSYELCVHLQIAVGQITTCLGYVTQVLSNTATWSSLVVSGFGADTMADCDCLLVGHNELEF